MAGRRADRGRPRGPLLPGAADPTARSWPSWRRAAAPAWPGCLTTASMCSPTRWAACSGCTTPLAGLAARGRPGSRWWPRRPPGQPQPAAARSTRCRWPSTRCGEAADGTVLVGGDDDPYCPGGVAQVYGAPLKMADHRDRRRRRAERRRPVTARGRRCWTGAAATTWPSSPERRLSRLRSAGGSASAERAGLRGPRGQLRPVRVADLDQGQPARRRDRDLIAAPARAAAARPASPVGRRPSPTAASAPTSERTIEWQNASACTSISIRPAVRTHVQPLQLADVRGALAAAAEGGEVVAARAAAGRPRCIARGVQPPPPAAPCRAGAAARDRQSASLIRYR